MDGANHIHITIDLGPMILAVVNGVQQQLTRIEGKVDAIQTKVDHILMTEKELKDLLDKIDSTTNQTASNVQLIATVDKQISDEIDAFIQATPAGTTLTDAQVAQLKSLGDRAAATADASTAQVAVLQAIAAKGAAVVPPPPPPPPALVATK